MKELLLEIVVCLVVAALLMIAHELFKAVIYIIIRGHKQNNNIDKKGIWNIFRYIDPLGLVLAVTCYVPVSKPYMFRVRDRKTNFIMGMGGFIILMIIYFSSAGMIHYLYGDSAGILSALNGGIIERAEVLFWQYMQMLCFDYFIVNLFPLTTFDMGLIIAGVSLEKFNGIIKADTYIKLVLVLTLILNLINTGYLNLIKYLPF